MTVCIPTFPKALGPSLVALSLLSACTTGLACPEVALDGQEIHASATDLWTPQRFAVTAGGSHNLSTCRHLHGSAVGHAAAAPDFELRFIRNANYALDFRVESSCDTVLLVNTASGQWLFNDDRDGIAPGIRIASPGDGWYDIWIGTYGPALCPATLVIETF